MSLRQPAALIPSYHVALALYGRRQSWLAIWWSYVANWRQR